jgi:outer membrane protein assembly factor BamA
MNQGAMVRGYGLYPYDTNLSGKKSLIFSSDITLPNPLSVSPILLIRDIVPSLFFDYGYAWDNPFPKAKDFRNNAGFSLSWDQFPNVLYYLTSVEKVQFDFPIFMSHLPDEEKRWEFRWLVRFDFDLD